MSTTPGRTTLAAAQILAARPDSGVGRASSVGAQVLAEQLLPPVRVSSAQLEVLVLGDYKPAGRMSAAGSQVLAATPPEMLRVSTSTLETLILGDRTPTGRLTTVAQQILAEGGPVPIRVSSSVLELLVVDTFTIAPGRFHGASLSATTEREYPAIDAPQSALTVNHVSQAGAYNVTYAPQGSFGQVWQARLSASVPSSILDFEPAARLYAQLLAATLPKTLPDPAAPQSDLDVSHLSESAGLSVGYPDKAEVLSLARAHGASTSATLPVTGLPTPDAPQSDLDVSHLSQATGLASEVGPEGSDLWVTSLDQRAAVPTESTPEGSDLWVTQISQAVATEVQYPAGYSSVTHLHGAKIAATVPAGWLDDYVTQVRTHSARLTATFAARAGVYVDPVLVRPSVEVSYLTNCVGYASADSLGGGSSAVVSYLTQQAAIQAFYSGTDAPQSTVTARELFVEVVRHDPSFATGATTASPIVANVSVTLIYESDA